MSKAQKQVFGPKAKSRRGRPSKREQALRGDARDILMNAAHEVMVDRDSIEISVGDIADRAGQSPAVVQYHFGGKDGLLRALLRRGTDRAVVQLTELARMDLPAEKKLRYHIRGLIRAYYEAPYVNQLMRHISDSAPGEEREEVFREFASPLADFYAALIDQGVAEGVFQRVRPMHLYMMVVGSADHIFARRKSLPALFGIPELTDESRNDYTEFLTGIILGGLRR
ncbi:MAG: TetR family transcriptional regulator [Pseudomonadota bacterium]|nr:TetR family transcriptional regulator [Pseudomonadota bacterium]